MNKGNFESRMSTRNKVKALFRQYKAHLCIGIVAAFVLFIGIAIFLKVSNSTFDLDTFEDKDISVLEVPNHLMIASENTIQLIDIYTKEVLDEVAFEGPIVIASDVKKAYFVLYDKATASIYEIYAIEKTDEDGFAIQTERIEDEIGQEITSIGISRLHYAYATEEKVYMKAIENQAIQQEINLENVEHIFLHEGMIAISNGTDFGFYSIYRSEPAYYKNYGQISVHLDDEGMVIANNYGKNNNFSLIYWFDRFGRTEKVVNLDDNELFILHSYPGEPAYFVKGNDKQTLLVGSMEELESIVYPTPINKGVFKNDVLYMNNSNLLLFYDKVPYYKINKNVMEFALLFQIQNKSPRQQQISEMLDLSSEEVVE